MVVPFPSEPYDSLEVSMNANLLNQGVNVAPLVLRNALVLIGLANFRVAKPKSLGHQIPSAQKSPCAPRSLSRSKVTRDLHDP
jgi:hypothetical protein